MGRWRKPIRCSFPFSSMGSRWPEGSDEGADAPRLCIVCPQTERRPLFYLPSFPAAKTSFILTILPPPDGSRNVSMRAGEGAFVDAGTCGSKRKRRGTRCGANNPIACEASPFPGSRGRFGSAMQTVWLIASRAAKLSPCLKRTDHLQRTPGAARKRSHHNPIPRGNAFARFSGLNTSTRRQAVRAALACTESP